MNNSGEFEGMSALH